MRAELVTVNEFPFSLQSLSVIIQLVSKYEVAIPHLMEFKKLLHYFPPKDPSIQLPLTMFSSLQLLISSFQVNSNAVALLIFVFFFYSPLFIVSLSQDVLLIRLRI